MSSGADFVVRLFRDGALEGGGLPIAADLILTCAHVVGQLDAEIAVDAPTRSGARRYAATVEQWQSIDGAPFGSPVRDLCVLRLSEAIVNFDVPVLALACDITGDPCRTIGFPEGYDNGIESTGAIGQRLPSGWYQLDAVRQPGHAIVPGFSGTPLWDDQLRAFVGIVAESDTQPGTKTATMIPLEVFARTFDVARRVMAAGLRARWRRWERSQRASTELRAALAPYSLHVPTAVTPLWSDFARSPAWHESVEREVGKLAEASNGLDLPPSVRDAVAAVEALDCGRSYPEILNALRTVLPKNLVGDIRALVREGDDRQRAAGLTRAFTLWRGKLHDMQQAAYQLTQFAAKPRFGRCLLLAGRFGSGKTHFAVSLLDAEEHESYGLHLPVELGAGGDIGGDILAAARAGGHIEWKSLAELDAMLNLLASDFEPALDLFIHLDDLHLAIRRTPSLLAGIARFVDTSTSLHSLRYIMTIQDAQYDRVAAQSEFWLRQTSFDTEFDKGGRATRFSHAGGWLILDDLNEQSQIGQAILRQAVPQPAPHQDELAPAGRALAHPLTAVILVHLQNLGAGSGEAASLNFPEFVEDFWRRRRATLDPALTSRLDLDEAIALLAQLLSELGETPPLRELLQLAEQRGRDLFGVPWPAERFSAALEVIETANLIRFDLALRDDPASRRLLLLFDAFWCHRLAVVLLRELKQVTRPKKVNRAVRSWFEGRKLPSLAEGILELLLLLLVRDEAGTDDDRATSIARAAFASDGLSASAPWLAGAHLDSIHQKRFLDGGLASIGGSSGARSTFSFVYFLRNAELSPGERIEAAARAFAPLAQHGLGSYFIYFFERTLEDFTSGRELATALLSMAGVETIQVTPDVAEIAAQRLLDLCGDRSVLDVLLANYLRPLSSRTPVPVLQETRWHRFFFREWLLHDVLSRLASRHHIGVYTMLARRLWYDGPRVGIRSPVSREMEREANIAIGARYRRGLDQESRDRYQTTLDKMIRSDDVRDQVAAFFIIRHTEPPSENPRVAVREELRPLLSRLSRIPEVVSRVAAFAGVFEANVEHFVAPPRKPRAERPEDS